MERFINLGDRSEIPYQIQNSGDVSVMAGESKLYLVVRDKKIAVALEEVSASSNSLLDG